MGEQHLDFLSPSPALVIGGRVAQIADRLAGFFIHVARDGSERRIGAGPFDRTRTASFFPGEVAFDPVGLLDPAERHFVAFKTGVAIALGNILEMAEIVLALGLMLAVQHRHMRREFTLQEPGQERAGAV